MKTKYNMELKCNPISKLKENVNFIVLDKTISEESVKSEAKAVEFPQPMVDFRLQNQ